MINPQPAPIAARVIVSLRRWLLALLSATAAFAGLWGVPSARAQTAPPEIVELARALKGDPDLIFEYVYNNIQTLPMHGSLKGALGALIDGQGTAWDQAELMVLLLRQSNIDARFVHGTIRLAGDEVANWLGTDTGRATIHRVLAFGGFTHKFASPSDPIDYVDLNWAWVQATIPGSSCGGQCVFDPATKFGIVSGLGYNRVIGMTPAALLSAMGYDRSTFVGDASAVTTTSPWALTSLNRSAVRNHLAEYATKLVQYTRTNSPAGATADVIGGLKGIVALPLQTQYRSTSTPRQWDSSPTVTIDIPSSVRVTLTQQFGWNYSNGAFTSLSSPITFNTADIYGHRMTVQFSAASVPSLLLDGVTQITASGAVPSGYQLTVRVSISYPWLTTGGYPGVTDKDDARISPAVNAIFAVTSSWGPTSRAMVERHRRLMQENTAAHPSNPDDESIVGEAFSIIAYTQAAEFSQHSRLIGQLSGTVPYNYYFYGTFGMTHLGGVTGPSMSMWLRAQNYAQAAARSFSPDAVNALESNAFVAEGLAHSVTESATLSQTQMGVAGISTVNMTDIAVQRGIRIFDINNNAISGDSAAYYGSTIRPQMASSYYSGDLSSIDAKVNSGSTSERIIAPQSGAIGVDQYTGAGWIRVTQAYGFDALGGGISGNLQGGSVGQPLSSSQVTNQAALSNSPPSTSSANLVIPGTGQGNAGGATGETPSSAEPINLVTGDYYLTTTDIATGSSGMPIGLAFQRYYDSGTRRTSGPMGFGWTHNFAITALADSDPYEGLASNSPINGAAAIAGTLVALDIAGMDGLTVGRPIERFVTGAIIYRWIADNLITNIVAIKQPGYIEHFVKLANGTFNPPPGSAATLSFDGATYTYIAKDRTTLAFNSAGNLAAWTSPAGPSMALAYDTSTPPRLTSITNSAGRSLTLSYGSGLLTQVTDDTGRNISFDYDASSNLRSFVDTLGQATTYVYDQPGRLINVFYPDAPGRPFVVNTYDSLSRVQTQSGVLGATWNYFFAGSRSEEIDPYGTRHVLYSTPHGKTAIEIQDLGGSSQTLSTNTWDALDRLALATAPAGNTVGYTYDLNSNPLTVTRTPKPGSPLSTLTTTTTYDPRFNKPATVTDPRGLVTAMTYEAGTGNLLSVTADSTGLQAVTRFTYNSLGQVLTTTDPNGVVARNSYDSSGNLVSAVRDATPGGLGLTTSWTWNARGDPLTATDPRGNVTTNTYDIGRRPTTTTTPATAAAPTGIVTAYTYDPAGRVTQAQQSSLGTVLRATSATYTLSGKTATTTNANGNVTRFAYDLLDRQNSITDPMGRVTRLTYTALGQPFRAYNTVIQAGPLLEQAWTADGLRASLKDANGNTTTFAYDGFDRLATTTYPGGTTETLAYDADSNVTRRCTRAGQPIAFTYDTLNRLIAKTLPGSAATCGDTPSGTVVTYAWDRAGRQTGISDNSASLPTVAATSAVFTTTTAWDALNRPTGVGFSPVATPTLPSNGSSVLFTHGYNAANQRTSLSVDAATPADWIAYPPGTPSTTAYTANSLNQYTAVGAASPAYDSNGNLTDDGSTYKFEYDPENRLVTAKTSGDATIATYAFDASGRRKSKTVGGTTTVFVTDPDNREVLEYDGGSGAIQRWYPYALGPNAVLGQVNVAGSTRSTPVPDLLGSIIASMDAGSGALTPFAYQPYGSATAVPSQFAYTSQRFDPEVSAYYYRARTYLPSLGRFLQADPSGYSGGANLYGYVGNDPLNWADPLGLAREASGGSVADLPTFGTARDLQPYPTYTGPSGTQGCRRDSCFAPAIPLGAAILDAVLYLLSAIITGIGLGEAISSQTQTDQIVVRGGVSEPLTLQRGVDELSPIGLPGKYGLPASSKPGLSAVEIAQAAGGYPQYRKISSTDLPSIQSLGYTVVPTPTRSNPVHVSILLPAGQTTLSGDQAGALSALFARNIETNPGYRPR
ncbi:MAG: hypothetical protein J0J01_13005 [Reyranella sp.]|uniref:RHS repeat-associated core domain-containing protein n=1 Tax=Reyranella sp. TaxID=1929291 RepID=UPI001AD29933|nr:RHS repeat-associated core domain-containing protein [Reyranella sp.]MBN9087822.1 hypothetical protein [Reyranella sp.]